MEGLKIARPRARIATVTEKPSTQTWLHSVLKPSSSFLEIVDVSRDQVDQVSRQFPDLVILEVETPSTHGLTLLREIRKEAPEVPVMVVTSAISSTQAQKVIRDGAVELVATTIEGPLLAPRVHRLLSLRTSSEPRSGKEATDRVGDIQVFLPEVHDRKTGRLDAERIANFLGVPLSKLAAALGANYAAVHKTPAADSLQEKLIPLKRCLEILASVLPDRGGVLRWLNSPHPDLGTRTPIQVILDGRVGAVQTILENSIGGIPT